MATTTTKTRTAAKANEHPPFLFDKTSYIWMIAGLVLILIGFILMGGGKSENPHQFNADEIYSFSRITLSPILILAGFVVEVFAIMRKPKTTDNSETA